MIKKMTFGFIFGLSIVSIYASDISTERYSMFPEAESGYVRYIIEVPKTENDADHKVELFVGKRMMVDCNHHSFSGKMEKIPLKGWGYNYYKVSGIQSGLTTMMACKAPKKEAFISVYLPSRMQFIRYNSRLGSVFYVPKGFEVRYRIWSVEGATMKAAQR